MGSIEHTIATDIVCKPSQVAAAVALLDDGATVPFIARYRKEATGGLDDTQLRRLEDRLRYLRELEDRRQAVLRSISERGLLTSDLEKAIQEADTRTRLEDLYLPYRPKRRTKAAIARDAGLEPLAESLLQNPTLDPQSQAERFVDTERGVSTPKEALDGARQILMERCSEDADLLTRLRTWLWDKGLVSARVVAGKAQEGSKYRDYFEHDEPLHSIAGHRTLALLRGRKEGILSVSLVLPEALELAAPHPCVAQIASSQNWSHQDRAADNWLSETFRWAWKVKLHLHLETELLGRIRELAEDEAIEVFARNLKALLLSPPAGARVTMGLDPGLRTGVKVVVVDETGKLLDKDTIFPHAPQNRWDASLKTLTALCQSHQVKLVAIGNGTASRETDRLVAELLKHAGTTGITKVVVNEAGASVYSASELAAREFPDLDVTYRGAVSIARRLQDPLAELVKIDPKAIGVGQYQHDVSQVQLARTLDAIVEDCVNRVGVDLNTASAALLARIAGLNSSIAENIVHFRETNGAFPSRKTLLKVPRLGEKTFEQAAGFLRISQGENPLDASSVHPEAYSVVTRMVDQLGEPIHKLLGNGTLLSKIRAQDFVDERFGVPTIQDILQEMEKPGRDPRPVFQAACFRDDIEKISDLAPGMVLEGTVTNVTGFGAFVDIGVHQDGLVHISMLANRFVKDPHEVVSPGQVVRVRVMDVDKKRHRIALSMRLDEPTADNGRTSTSAPARPASENARKQTTKHRAVGQEHSPSAPKAPASALAAAFARAQRKPDEH